MAVAFRSSSTSSNAFSGSPQTVSFSKPAGTSVGDVLYAFIGNFDGTAITGWGAPSGWTQLATPNDGASQNVGLGVFRRVVDGTEPSTISWSLTSGGNIEAEGIMRCYSGGDTTTVEDVVGSGTSAENSTTVTAPSITTTKDGDAIILAFASGSYNASNSVTYTTPSGYGNAVTVQAPSNSQASLMTCDRIQATHGATSAQTSTTTNTAGTWGDVGIQVALMAPAAAASTLPQWLNDWPQRFMEWET